jgi:hypothetical protein
MMCFFFVLTTTPRSKPTTSFATMCYFKVVWAVDKYPVNNRGVHKKYIHMMCGCCKTMFIGCEVIGKSILKSNQ